MAHPFTHSIHAHSAKLDQTVTKEGVQIMDSTEARIAADIWAAEQSGADDWCGVIRVAYVQPA